jgi:hypothetical protein
MRDQTPSQFPLHWPPFVPRTQKHEAGQFKVTLAAALGNVQTSLRMFGKDSGKAVSGVVLSSNVTLGHANPADPGIAVWFLWEGEWRCIAVDRFTRPESNLQAIHKIIEARRAETRYGTLHMVRAAFTGFLALPGGEVIDWRKVLGLDGRVTLAQVEEAYRDRLDTAHPDKGGTTEAMTELNAARAAAKRELSA